MLEVGDSFTLPNEHGEHLHIIIAEQSPESSASILLVYVSSSEIPSRDPTTLIEIGEHPFIKKKSWVRYQNVLESSRPEISKIIKLHYGKVDENLLVRIQKGLEESNRVSEKMKELFHQWKMDKLYRETRDQS